MPELNFTPEQRAAIDTRGSTVLVSAAAGSGRPACSPSGSWPTSRTRNIRSISTISSSSPTRARPRPSYAAAFSTGSMRALRPTPKTAACGGRSRCAPAPRSARSTASAPTSCAPTVQPSPSRRTFRSPIPSAAPPCAQRRSSTRSSAPIHASTPTHPSTCWPTRSAAGATMRAWASWCSRSMTKCSATHGPSSGRSGKWTCSRSTA